MERRDGVKERDVKRNWDQTEIEDKCCFCRAALSINTSRHTCSPLKGTVKCLKKNKIRNLSTFLPSDVEAKPKRTKDDGMMEACEHTPNLALLLL